MLEENINIMGKFMGSRLLALRAISAIAIVFAAATAVAQVPALLLYGGHGHDKFLGCVNCSEYDSGSICNEYGQFGSSYNSDSIWNDYGQYGSSYSSLSPWNTYANDPPVIVDKDGKFYGYLTASEYHPKRTQIKALIALTDAAEKLNDLDKLREAFCRR